MKSIIILFVTCICCSGYSYSKKSVALSTSFMPIEKQVTLTNQITLDYIEQGNKNGLPVILLHGFTDSWHSYDLVLPYLSDQLHVFAITHRGHGNSSKPSTGYAITDFADDVAAFMTALKLDAAVLVGHSMSSSITQCFAVQYPERTRGIVLVGAFANYEDPGMLEFRDYVSQLNDPIDSAFVVDFQRSTLHNPIALDQFKIFVEETLKVPASVWRATAEGWRQADFTNDLMKSSIPALMVWGEKDTLCTRSDQKALIQALQNSTWKVYENTGHAVHWEKPQQFASDLTQFVLGIEK